MLESLSIRNIVLIEELHLEFEPGLCVLTGETGAGKSILLDALGLALGTRAEGRLLRHGATQAQVTASFRLPSSHPFWQTLYDLGITHEGNDLLFRRHLEDDGKSKCFLNDQPISQNLMLRLGKELVEVHGQFDHLLEPKSHLAVLDAYGKIDKEDIRVAFKIFQGAKQALQNFQENLQKSFERQTFLRFAIEEIEKLSPRPGEEEELETERSLIAHRAKLVEAFKSADSSLTPLIGHLSQSHKTLSKVQDILPERITPLMEASDRAILEIQEILEGLNTLRKDGEDAPHTLESLENRLYALKSLSRKYQCPDLLQRLAEFKEEFSLLEQGEDHIQKLEETVALSKEAFLKKAQTLSGLRHTAATKLEGTLAQEFPPLKLDHTKFRVHFEELSESTWRETGIDQVEFYIRTNPDMPEGAFSQVASGGELSRLMLGLKVILTQAGAIPTLIFDEIESGTGGAVASAMGERLKNLSQNSQILAITHSPQIASFGSQHMVVHKIVKDGKTTTHVKQLPTEERYEEVARMLAGDVITEEARAAAKRLMG
jgi:DNA repair protein RecN (Recombination protein N)